jgi:hypothetical protein
MGRRIKIKGKKLRANPTDTLRAEHRKHNRDMREINCHHLTKTFEEYIEYKYGRRNRVTNATVAHDPQAIAHYRRPERHIPSMNSGLMVAEKRDENTYTGDVVQGLGTMHKSNTTVVLNKDVARDLATMRRG